MNKQQYWLGFSLVPMIGPKRVFRLLDHFGDIEAAWLAAPRELERAGLDKRPLENFVAVRQRITLDDEMAKIRKAGAWLVTLGDDLYPALLKKVEDPPIALYVRGTLTPADELALAVVGTRKATIYGQDTTSILSRQLARQGITIVSGLAHGVDNAAHRAAVEVGGRTIAVLGCGIEQIYPRDQKSLAETIMANGALISEFPIGVRPEGRNFPRRNRVISGLSLGVLVTQAPIGSGALITAEIAAEQGREVFAVPGNIFNPASAGTNKLIADGAKLVCNVNDILEELNIAHDAVQIKRTTERVAPDNELEKHLLSYMSLDPIHIDDLARLCGLPIAKVSSTLTILELKGLARSAGNMQYSLIPSQLF